MSPSPLNQIIKDLLLQDTDINITKLSKNSWTRFGLMISPMAVFCEHNNEPSNSIKSTDFIDQLSKLSAFQAGFYTIEKLYSLVAFSRNI
jgi:hypothetical protein